MSTGKTKRTLKASGRAPQPDVPDDSRLSHDAIAHRAYELYLARGRADGNAIDDWLQAEHELRDTRLKA